MQLKKGAFLRCSPVVICGAVPLVACLLLLAGCASNAGPAAPPEVALARPPTPAEKAMRERSFVFSRTIVEGTALGAGTGALIGAIACKGDPRCIVIGILAGGALGGTAGHYYAVKKDRYRNEEQRLDAIIAEIEEQNAIAEAVVADTRSVMAKDAGEVERLHAELSAGRMTREAYDRELAALDLNRKVLQRTVVNLSRRRDEWREVASRVHAESRSHSEQIDGQIRRMEREIALLNAELDAVTSRRIGPVR